MRAFHGVISWHKTRGRNEGSKDGEQCRGSKSRTDSLTKVLHSSFKPHLLRRHCPLERGRHIQMTTYHPHATCRICGLKSYYFSPVAICHRSRHFQMWSNPATLSGGYYDQYSQKRKLKSREVMSLHTVVKAGNGWQRRKLSLGFGLPGEHRLALTLFFSACRLLRGMGLSYCHWPQSLTPALAVFVFLF